MLTKSLSENDLRLLGYSEIVEDVAYSDAEALTVYRAVAPAGLRQVRARFVHAKSKCSGTKLAAVLQELPSVWFEKIYCGRKPRRYLKNSLLL